MADDDVTIQKLQFPDERGGLTLQARSPAFAVLLAEVALMFTEGKGVNYVELALGSPDPKIGNLRVVIQREAGKTPAQRATELLEALKDYGAHKRSCDSFDAPSRPCTCGLDRIITQTGDSLP